MNNAYATKSDGVDSSYNGHNLPGRSTKFRSGDFGSLTSTRTLLLENCILCGSTSLSSVWDLLRKSVWGRCGLKIAACARLIHRSTDDLSYIISPKGTVRLPSSLNSVNWRLMQHDHCDSVVVLLIMHSIGHLWTVLSLDVRILRWLITSCRFPNLEERLSAERNKCVPMHNHHARKRNAYAAYGFH
jgi:hypothetical protein